MLLLTICGRVSPFSILSGSHFPILSLSLIHISIRVVVVDLDVLSEDYPEYKGFRKAYINAHILEVSGEEVSMEEGCLSLPGIHESVKRGNKIRVKYLDEDLVEHDEIVEGYLARVMQHEFDHLDGKMFIDHPVSYTHLKHSGSSSRSGRNARLRE